MGGIAGGIAQIAAPAIGGMLGQSGAFGSRNTFNPASAPLNTQQFAGAIKSSQDVSNRNFQNEQALAEALQAQTRGQGPSLAQSQLQQATNRNIAQNAGLIASQKGINPALATRAIAQNAAMTGQEMAGQSGLLRSQEQLGAQQQLGGVLGTLGGQSLEQQQLFQSANAAQNQALLGQTNQQNQLNAARAQQGAEYGQKILGGAISGGGAAAGKMFGLSDGGEVPGEAKFGGDDPKNDTVDAKLSPDEIVLPRTVTKSKDAGDKAKEFVEHIKGQASKKELSYGDVLASHQKLMDRMDKLEKRVRGA